MSQSRSTTDVKAVSNREIQLINPAKAKGAQEFSGIKWLDFIVGEYEFNRYGIYTIALLLIGCLAGAAVGLGAMSSPVEIAILVIPTLAALSLILAVAPMRLIVWTVILACLIDTALIIYHILL